MKLLRIDRFRSLNDFTTYFSTDKRCRAYLEQVLWDNEPTCPFCGNMTDIWRFEDGKYFKCSGCKKRFKVTQKTMFEGTHLPLTTWFTAIYLVSTHSKGLSSIVMSNYLGTTQKTAWFLLHRIRESMKIQRFFKGGILEVDEAYIGGKPRKENKRANRVAAKAGRGTEKIPVVGIVERKGQVMMEPMAVIQSVVEQYIKANAKTGGTIYTDSLNVYNKLKETYNHETVDHQVEFARGTIHTNTIEGVWALFKRVVLGIYHRVSAWHLGAYCVEFSYRYNERMQTMKGKFDRLLINVFGKRIRYKDLVAVK